MARKYSLFYLLPYLARHKLDMGIGFLMVVLTVVAGMFGPGNHVLDDHIRDSSDCHDRPPADQLEADLAGIPAAGAGVSHGETLWPADPRSLRENPGSILEDQQSGAGKSVRHPSHKGVCA